MAKESDSKPKSGNSTEIKHGKHGGTQFIKVERTKTGTKRTIYDVPPKKKG